MYGPSHMKSNSTLKLRKHNKQKREFLMSAKTRATPNENFKTPKNNLTQSLGAVNIKNILNNGRPRIPSAITSNTTKLRSLEETNETVQEYHQEYLNQRHEKMMTIHTGSPIHSKNFSSQYQLNNTYQTLDPNSKLGEMIQQRPSFSSRKSLRIRKKKSQPVASTYFN